METRTKARDFVRDGYEVKPTVNGGFVVRSADNDGRNPFSTAMAAFTNEADLLKWLSAGHAEASNG